MRIGHQIYNYLYDYTDTGTFSLKEGIGLPNCDFSIMGAYINFKENQVYVILKDQRCNVINKTIHQFVCQMGGPNYHSYRPLYHLRDTLRINAKHWIKKYKWLRILLNNQECEGLNKVGRERLHILRPL